MPWMQSARRGQAFAVCGIVSATEMSGASVSCEFGAKCGICADTGSTFRKEVFHIVARIPVGRVWTYKAVASAAGNANASRAVGNALRGNPYNFDGATPRVPCHRVVGKNRIGGFYGTEKVPQKIALLKSEGPLDDTGRLDPVAIVSEFVPDG